MKFGFLLLILLSAFQIPAQKVYTYQWGTSPKNHDLPANDSLLIPLDNWQIQLAGQSQNVTGPFVVSFTNELTAQTTFVVNSENKSQNLFLLAQGIKGSATVYLNNHLISFVANGGQPFKIPLPAEFFTKDSRQILRLKIKQPQNTREGFPIIPYTYSESHAIGLSAPMMLVSQSPPGITDFEQRLVPKGNVFELQYAYRVHIRGAYKRLQIAERFQRQSDGKILFRKLRFAKELGNKTLNIKGTFPLSPKDIWNLNDPQKITLRIKATFSGKHSQIIKRNYSFGARTFRWHKGQFYLNGAPIAIKGITWHQNLTRFRGASYYNTIKNDLQHIKSLGINAVRLSHFLPTPRFLDVCDSLGLLVFAELPLWRYPQSFFEENFLLETAKNVCLQSAPFYRSHPSLVAFGLGQELPVDYPVTQKFLFILNGKIKTLLPVVTYVSPIPGHPLPPEKVADFYMFDLYRPLNVLHDAAFAKSTSLIGKIGVLSVDLFRQERQLEAHEINRGLFLKEEIGKALFLLKTAGGFIESYQDWFVPYPSLVSKKAQASYIIPQGLYRVDGEPKPWTKLLHKPWEIDRSTAIQINLKKERPTNFYSILITFFVLLFFSLYRRLPRLRENLRRSLRHSYGFFVDMRERRIIPLLNSITVGIFFSIIVAAFISSQIYFYHGSYWLQEVMAVFLIPLRLFAYYLKISQSYWLLTAVLFLIFFLLPFAGAIGVKLFSLFGRARVRLRQGVAVMYWSGAPLLWFFPVSLISYHWIFYGKSAELFWIILALFFLWIHFRLVKGLHILFNAGTSTIFIVLLLCYSVPLLIFWALFNPPSYWFDYLKLLMNAQALF